MMLNSIIWKPIIGFEEFYEVSNTGQVKAKGKHILHWRECKRFLKEKLLIKSLDKDGYETITLKNNGYQKTYRVHRLVALHFIDNEFNKPTVNHINGIKNDNNVSNLEWATHRENSSHRSMSKEKTSKYSNIHLCKKTNKWICQIQIDSDKKHIGCSDSEEIAYIKLNEYKIKYGIK